MAPPAPPSTEQLLTLLQKTLGHELPNQLIAVQGLAGLLDLEAGASLNPECQDYLHRLSAAAQRAHETIRALGDFLRAFRTDRPIIRISVAEMVREVRAEIAGCFPGVTLEVDFPTPPPFLALPAFALRQIVLHLLRHAHQASVNGGKIVTASGIVTPNGVELRIHDGGPSLTPDQQAKLFDPLACRGLATPFGLGLELARQLLANWGATLAVQSDDAGNTLIAFFPTPG